MPLMASEPAWGQEASEPSGPSYDELWRVFKPGGGVKDVDPNVYVYTREFAKRFQMPTDWVSSELKGVDAVSFRVVPSPYKTCGWGGSPKGCRTDEVRCEMDLYFDQKSNPLPWDERFPEIVSNHYGYSYRFMPGINRNLRLPKHPNEQPIFGLAPFVDSKTGKGLWWHGGYWNSKMDRGGILMSMTSYDENILKGVALLTMSGACGQAPDTLWLGTDNGYYEEARNAFKLVSLPRSWRARVQQALLESKERDEAFIKREGEKAMNALRDSPIPSKQIIPLQ